MPEGDDPEGASGPPPHPLDRVWFHPTELSAYMAATGTRRTPRTWFVGGAAALAGAVLTVGVLLMTGSLDGGGAVRAPFVAGTSAPSVVEPPDVSDVVVPARRSLVRVAVPGPDGGPIVPAGFALAVGKDRVLTTAGTVAGAPTIWIVSRGSNATAAKLLGVDPTTDLALLGVDGAGIPVPRFASIEGVRVGDDVIALTAGPAGEQWVSKGVVSTLNRLVVDPAGPAYAGMIETDTRATAGSAGGALLDHDGAVIGLLSGRGGFAIPIDVARDVAQQLGASGKAAHGWLGVWGVDVLDRAGGGVRVQQIALFGPAMAGHLLVGDVITAIGDDAVANLDDLVAAVRRRTPGDPVTLTVVRGTKRVSLNVKLGTAGGQAPAGAPGVGS